MSDAAEKSLSETVQSAVDEYLGAHKGGFVQAIIGMVQFVDSDGKLMNLMIEPREQSTSATLGMIQFLNIWSDVYARQQIIHSLIGNDEEDEEDD